MQYRTYSLKGPFFVLRYILKSTMCTYIHVPHGMRVLCDCTYTQHRYYFFGRRTYVWTTKEREVRLVFCVSPTVNQSFHRPSEFMGRSFPVLRNFLHQVKYPKSYSAYLVKDYYFQHCISYEYFLMSCQMSCIVFRWC